MSHLLQIKTTQSRFCVLKNTTKVTEEENLGYLKLVINEQELDEIVDEVFADGLRSGGRVPPPWPHFAGC